MLFMSLFHDFAFSFCVVLGKKLRRTLLVITFYCHLMPFLVWMSCKHRARWFRKKNVDGDLKWNREQLSLTNWALFRDKSPSKRRRGISLCIFSLNLRRKSWKWLRNSLQFYFPLLWASLLWRNGRKMCTKAVSCRFPRGKFVFENMRWGFWSYVTYLWLEMHTFAKLQLTWLTLIISNDSNQSQKLPNNLQMFPNRPSSPESDPSSAVKKVNKTVKRVKYGKMHSATKRQSKPIMLLLLFEVPH